MAHQPATDDPLPPAPGSPGNRYLPPQPGFPGAEERSDPSGPPQGAEAYINTPADRSHDQWGNNDYWLDQGKDRAGQGMMPGPYMPQASDFGAVIFGIAAGLGSWGSRNVGMPAIAMGTYATSFLENLRDGNKERAGNDYTKYKQSREMMLDRMQDEIQDGREAFALYRNNPAKLTAALQNIAKKYQWDALTNALATHDTAAVEKLFQALDSKWVDTKKMEYQEEERQRKKEKDDLEINRMREQEKDREEKRRDREEKRRSIEEQQRRWGITAPVTSVPEAPEGATPGGGPGGGAEDGTPDVYDSPGDRSDSSDQSEAPAAPSATRSVSAAPPSAARPVSAAPPADTTTRMTDTGGAAPAAQPVRFAEAGTTMTDAGPQAPAKPATPLARPEDPRQPPSETPQIEQAARDWVMFGHKLPPNLKDLPVVSTRILNRGLQIESELGRIASDPRIGPKDVVPAVRKLLPEFANSLVAAVHGDLPAPRTYGTANSTYWNAIFSLGRKMDPNFTADTFAERARARIFWTSGAGGNKLTSVGTAYDHLNVLRDDIKKGMKPARYVGTFIEKQIGSETIGRWENDLVTASHEYENALASSGAGGGGSATIPALRREEEEMSVNQSDKALLGNIESKIDRLGERLRNLKGQYESSTGNPAESIHHRFDEFLDKNVAADSLRELQNRKHDAPNGGSSGVHTPQELEGARRWLADPKNANDPRRGRVEQTLRGQ